MSENNFNIPSRQSAKGIIVIFGVSVYKVIKGLIIVIAAFFLKYFQSGEALDIYNYKVILSVAAFILYFIIFAILKYLNFKFYINKDYFILKQGIINKEETSISKSKIQNVYIKQNVIQQIINVVSLSIETAGDDKTEIEIKALSKSKAEALKKQLLSSARVEGNLEKKEDIKYSVETTNVYYKASFKKLLLEGISENHLKSLVFVLAFIFGLYNDFKEFIKQFKVTSRFNEYFELDEQALLGLIMFNVTLLILLLITSFLFSLIKTVVQNFNLTVYRKKDGLEISKGLFNKINLGLVSSRIQNTTISTNKFKKALGLYKLSFTQAMVNKKQQLKFNIIGLNKTQINELINEFYSGVYTSIQKYKPNRYFILKEIMVNIFLLLLINIPIIFAPPLVFLINIPLVILFAANTLYAYKKAYYSIDNNYIVVGTGKLIETHTSFLETHKVQAVKIKQTIFQKKRKLATVKVYSASKAITIPHIELNIARDIKNFLLYKVESEDRDWM